MAKIYKREVCVSSCTAPQQMFPGGDCDTFMPKTMPQLMR